MSKAGEEESSLSERPGHHRPRRLADWINPTGARKVHSLIDKVYKRKNLEIAWERARLRARVQELEAEVDQLKRENLDLQSEVDELRGTRLMQGAVARPLSAPPRRR
jgi:predicted RNase H-like nuclease (RuvC/YqgF family)